MIERPILFNSAMVRALLDGSKTQTRRVLKLPPWIRDRGLHPKTWEWMGNRYTKGSGQYPGGNPRFTGDQPPGLMITCNDGTCQRMPCPYGVPGDRLWCRETWRADYSSANPKMPDLCEAQITYAADGATHYHGVSRDWIERWAPKAGYQPSIFMSRWASRITLEVTDVRVERVAAISAADARAEGPPMDGPAMINGELGHVNFFDARRAFACLWDSINGKRVGCSWEANPWVWVVGFKVVTP